VQCSAVQCSAVQCSAVQCSAVQCRCSEPTAEAVEGLEEVVVENRCSWPGQVCLVAAALWRFLSFSAGPRCQGQLGGEEGGREGAK
jgi:hypothetical protein